MKYVEGRKEVSFVVFEPLISKGYLKQTFFCHFFPFEHTLKNSNNKKIFFAFPNKYVNKNIKPFEMTCKKYNFAQKP